MCTNYECTSYNKETGKDRGRRKVGGAKKASREIRPLRSVLRDEQD